MLTINTINNINFDGRFRYVAITPKSANDLYEIGKDRISNKVIEFSEKSVF